MGTCCHLDGARQTARGRAAASQNTRLGLSPRHALTNNPPLIDRLSSQPYVGWLSGLRTGSPPFPPPRLIRPTVRLLLRPPRFSGPGPHRWPCQPAARQGSLSPIRLPSAPFLRSSETLTVSPDDAERGTGPLEHYPRVCRGSPWPGPGRDGPRHRTAPPS